VAAALYAVAALMNAAMAGRLHTRAPSTAPGQPQARDWLAGVRVLNDSGPVANVAGLAALRSLGRGLWLALATLAALGFLDLGRSGVGTLLALSGVGVLLAIPVSALLVARPHLRGPLVLALSLCGAPLVAIAVAGSAGVAFAAVVVWGFGMAFADVILTALQLRMVDATVLSRTVGAVESLKIGAEGAGALLAPALVALVGLRPAIALAGATPLVVGAAEWNPLRRVDRIAARRVRRLRLLHAVPLFAVLGVDALERLAAGARRVVHRAGEDVIREGDAEARDFYVIERGRAEVRLTDWPVAVLGPGESFGERALLRDAPRAATVRALEDLRLQAIDRRTFLAALTGTSQEARLERPRETDVGSLLETLRSLPLLASLDEAALNDLAAAGSLRSVSAGEAIIREGEDGEELYVVLRGTVRVEREGATIAQLLPGDHFGEIALLHDVRRSATVRASEDALLLSIGREAYARAAGALPARRASGAQS
jgi:CRP-like cAMP-binding protein